MDSYFIFYSLTNYTISHYYNTCIFVVVGHEWEVPQDPVDLNAELKSNQLREVFEVLDSLLFKLLSKKALYWGYGVAEDW